MGAGAKAARTLDGSHGIPIDLNERALVTLLLDQG